MGTRPGLRVWLAAATTILTWASAYSGVRAGLHAYSPAHVAVLRILSASAAFAIAALLTRMRLPGRRDLPLIFLLGIVGFSLYSLALNTGQLTVPSGPSAVIVQTSPIWVALLATLLLGERLPSRAWLGIALSFAGVVLIGLAEGEGLRLRPGLGLVLLAALSTSCYFVLQKPLLARYHPIELTAYAAWAGALQLLPFAGGLVPAVRDAPLSATINVLYLGVGPVAIGYSAWAYVLARLPASRASSLLYVVPVVAFLFGWVQLGELPTLGDIAGALVIIMGVVMVNARGQRVAQSPAPLPD